MKIFRTLSLLAACLFAASVTSCVSDGLTEPGNDVVGKEIATLEEQASSVMTTISDVKALKETADGHEVELNGIIRSLENHVSYLSSGSSWEDATLATLAEQKKLAAVVGPILAQTDAAGATKTTINSLDANAKSWLGKNMGAYWSAVLAEAQTDATLAVLGNRMRTQRLHVEGLASDVEAGLKKGEKPEELESLAKSVADNIEDAEELGATVSALVSDLEETYRTAVQTAAQAPASYDTKSVNAMNRAAAVALAANDVTLQSLAERVDACEAQLEDISTRLGELEGKVENLEKLLDLIQSVNLMQDNSSDYAVAYYNLDPDDITDDGCMRRVPKGTIDLRYLVRPASAAAALTEETLWNNGLKVIGYYAQSITKAAVETFDLTVQNVVEDPDIPGLVTVTVVNAFDSEDFYLKKIGAKVALSITSDNNDITSKFVEIIPQDESGTVYAESLTVTESIEIELNETATIKAVLNPIGADQTLIWMSDNEDVVTVSDEGVLTTTGVGTANVTATSVTTDEYGRKLSATCNVTVNPDIKIVGPKFVEEGYSINLRLDCPRNINPEQITWTVSNTSAVSVEKTIAYGMNCAVVTGNVVAYNDGYEDITITCAIAGETTLTHTVQCVEVQPRDIDITGLTAEENENNEITLKFGQSRTFGASIVPNIVDAEKFTLSYGHSGEGLTRSNQTITAQDENTLKNGKVTGYFNVEVNSDWYWYDKTFQTIADKITRKITVNVEPYYVTGLSIPASQNMTKDQVLTTLPDIVFTSDDPKNIEKPSYTDLVWSSSAPEYVSVGESTGTLTALQLTNIPVIITATIKDPEKSVKPGYAVSASCSVTVTEADAGAPKVGDYYYKDGSWSTDNKATAENPVIGVIFSLANAADANTGDPNLGCYSNGLVLSTMEFTSIMTSNYNPQLMDNGTSLYEYLRDTKNNTASYDHTKTNGYSATQGLKAWRQYKSYGSDNPYAVTVLDDASLPAPENGVSSGWYVPSYQELLLIYNAKTIVNEVLRGIGTEVGTGYYWSSSLFYENTGSSSTPYHDSKVSPFNMNDGTMATPASGYSQASYGPYSTSYPVRVVLAF